MAEVMKFQPQSAASAEVGLKKASCPSHLHDLHRPIIAGPVLVESAADIPPSVLLCTSRQISGNCRPRISFSTL
jgi:hypothetical protein